MRVISSMEEMRSLNGQEVAVTDWSGVMNSAVQGTACSNGA
jgi:hypothetical protein